MSYTTLYRVQERHGILDIISHAEFKNSHGGAMFTWDAMARQYKDWDGMPFMDEQRQQAVWDLWEDRLNVSYIDRLVLASTFDHVFVRNENENLAVLAHAFKEFHKKYATQGMASSLWAQSESILEIIQKVDEIGEVWGICWQQTSTSEYLWFQWNEELGEDLVYDFLSEGEAWELFDAFEKSAK